MTQRAHKTKLKICLVSISLAKGGAERSVAMLSEMLTAKGHDVHLAVLTNEIDFNHSSTLFNLGELKSENDYFFARIFRFKKLRKYLIAQDFDVIIDHRPKNNSMRELFYSNYVYKNIPTMYVIHSSNVEEYFTNNPVSMVKLYNNCLATICVSNYIHKEIASKLGVTNSVTIHNAFNPSWKETKSNEALITNPYILSYGRLYDAIKDFSFLIRSFDQSNVWKQGVHLVIMGAGPDKEMLQEFASTMNSSAFISFLPYKKDPFEIIKNAKCVTLTSIYEGFPMVLVESLSLGTPVVSLDIVSGPSEIIEHKKNGLLIKERETENFATALHTICTNEALYLKLKEQTLASVTQFSMQEISEKWNQLLQDVIR